MSSLLKYVPANLLIGILFCQSAFISAQEVTEKKEVNRVYQEEMEANRILEIDTSDYLPAFYETSLNYNLLVASSKGYESEIDRLISKGAEINTETAEGITPLTFAVINNHPGAVKTLLKYNPVLDKITSSGETPLIIAVKNNNFDICEELIRAGADVDFTDRNGATPLHFASINGYLGIADLLLYYEASIDQKSDDGITPLLAAIMAGFSDVADLLIQNGANMEARNNKGNTPFLMASVNGDTLMMDLLFKHGVDIYAANNAYYNALDMAILTNQPDAARYLLRIGNNWAGSLENSIDPYVVAAKYRRKEMVKLLRENNIPGQIKYGIDQAAITLSSRFTVRDYYTGLSLSFKEPYLNGGIISGLDMKLWYTRVLIRDSEHLYYQYRDKGYLAYAGLFKDFMLSENPFKSNFIFTTTLLAGYSFGHKMKGTSIVPANEFLVIPDISLKWNRNNFSITMGMEYIRSQFYHIGPLWLRAGCTYTLFFDRTRTRVTPIKWY